MDFIVDMDYGLINDQNHLNNLHKHITRTAKKYDDIRDDVFVYVAKSMDENLVYNKNLVHVVVQAESHDFDGVEMTPAIFYVRDKIERSVALFIAEYLVDIHDKIKELTVVAGKQPDGSNIVPCVHIIYEAENIDDDDDDLFISDLMISVSTLDNIIYEI